MASTSPNYQSNQADIRAVPVRYAAIEGLC
jgi:hypothetical protein